MRSVAPRIVNDVLYVTKINHESHFAWQAQYLVRLVMPVPPRIVNNVSYVTRIDDASHFAWQAQHLVMLEDEICCSAHCK